MATVEHCLYCFDILASKLSNRPPMTLSQIEASWTAYPKGLEEGIDLSGTLPNDQTKPYIPEPPKVNTPFKNGSKRIYEKTLAHISNPTSPTATSSSSSSSTLDAPLSASSTAATTPSSSTAKFTPIGLSPHKTSQLSTSRQETYPLFVTFNSIHTTTAQRSLRGCIGTFDAQPLESGLETYTLYAGLSDTRFSPIRASELPNLDVSVTLLTDFEDADNAMDWELGVHGIRISFISKLRRYGACYLPDVAVEQGWDKEETIISLMRKAGWGGRKSAWSEVAEFKLVRFQGVVQSVGWEDYRDWRAWVGKRVKEGVTF